MVEYSDGTHLTFVAEHPPGGGVGVGVGAGGGVVGGGGGVTTAVVMKVLFPDVARFPAASRDLTR
jgi:hypothetical protein